MGDRVCGACSARTCLWPPPVSATWHCAHLVLKILAPASEKREGVAVSGPTQR